MPMAMFQRRNSLHAPDTRTDRSPLQHVWGVKWKAPPARWPARRWARDRRPPPLARAPRLLRAPMLLRASTLPRCASRLGAPSSSASAQVASGPPA